MGRMETSDLWRGLADLPRPRLLPAPPPRRDPFSSAHPASDEVSGVGLACPHLGAPVPLTRNPSPACLILRGLPVASPGSCPSAQNPIRPPGNSRGGLSPRGPPPVSREGRKFGEGRRPVESTRLTVKIRSSVPEEAEERARTVAVGRPRMFSLWPESLSGDAPIGLHREMAPQSGLPPLPTQKQDG